MKPLATFTVRETTGITRIDDLLVSGVPLAPGVTDGVSLALLDAEGCSLPLQADVPARWADGSAKWLLLTVPHVAISGGGSARLRLVHGGTPPPAGMRVRETEDGITVDTGRLRFTIARRDTLVPLFESRVNGAWQPRARDLELRTTVEHDGTPATYRASLGARTLTIESRGPLRTVIAVKGTHHAADGRTFGPYILRFEIFADSPQVRLTHSVIFDGNPTRDFLRASEVTLAAVIGEGQQFGFGGDEGHEVRFARQRAEWSPDFRHAELYQDAVTHWRVRRWVTRERREVFCEEGLAADGWMELAGTAGRLAVAVRDFRENHPKALAVDAATGEMRIGLYPARADRLDLQRYSDLSYGMLYESPCRWTAENIPFDQQFNARGIRKTHTLALLFDEPNPSAATLALNRPLMLQWTPGYLAKTGAVVPAAAKVDGAWKRRIGEYLDFLGLALLRDGGTGYVDYFDLPIGINLVEGRWLHDYGGKGYINDEAMPCLGLWQAYFLTGREDAFRLARAMTRHNGDIDSYYLGPYAGYGSRHNTNHWGDMDKEPRISQPVGKKFLYYLTGDRSVLDLVEVMLDTWQKRYAEPGRIGLTAHLPALVSSLLVAEETGLAAVEDWLRAIADALAASVDAEGRLPMYLEVDAARHTARALPDSGHFSFMMFSCFGGPQTFAELAERYRHQPLRDALVRFARYQAREEAERRALDPDNPAIMHDSLNTFRALDLFGYAYQLTGDPLFVGRVRRAADYVRVVVDDLRETRYGVPEAGRRRVLRTLPWPDVDPRVEEERTRKHYPLPGVVSGQFFDMAVYLHKMQGLMLLSTAKRAIILSENA